MNWTEKLDSLLRSVVYAQSGQVGFIEIRPPDERVPISLIAQGGSLILKNGGNTTRFVADDVTAAISAYASAVEGYA